MKRMAQGVPTLMDYKAEGKRRKISHHICLV